MADGGAAGKGASVISIRELMDGGTVDFTGSGSEPAEADPKATAKST
jgi:hypothetical protein